VLADAGQILLRIFDILEKRCFFCMIPLQIKARTALDIVGEEKQARTAKMEQLKKQRLAKEAREAKSEKIKQEMPAKPDLPMVILDTAATTQPAAIGVEPAHSRSGQKVPQVTDVASMIAIKAPPPDHKSHEAGPSRDVGTQPGSRGMTVSRLLIAAICFAVLFAVWRGVWSDPTKGWAFPLAVTIGALAIAWFVDRRLLVQKRPPGQK
jgi:hypothetical protein